MNILVPVLRRKDDGLIPWKIAFLYSKKERERRAVAAELWELLGSHNPNSSVNAEEDPSRANSHLHHALWVLPLDFLLELLEYSKGTTQYYRNVLQRCLRSVRSAEDSQREVVPESTVRRIKLYLNSIAIFTALTTPQPQDISWSMVNHAERTKWRAHNDYRSTKYRDGYFFYTIVWEYAPLPSNSDLEWLDKHAMELAPYRGILSQRPFDRGLCEVILSNKSPVISSGAL